MQGSMHRIGKPWESSLHPAQSHTETIQLGAAQRAAPPRDAELCKWNTLHSTTPSLRLLLPVQREHVRSVPQRCPDMEQELLARLSAYHSLQGVNQLRLAWSLLCAAVLTDL
ncbi:unnamed protein product [Pleuronectes platessa]|uniref:Uncharacterized protein n=1 Tax=Pleuronectes platessa TaxID=8262 RepID=A0A9N7VD70_PLEPL|nr:unnamed protein product [Pleuronectes platessa]